MLAGTGLGDNASLAHAARQQNLPQHVIHLVGARVIELVALEIDFRPARATVGGGYFAQMLGKAFGEIERTRAADVMRQIEFHLAFERRIDSCRTIGTLKLEDKRHQRLGDEAPAEQTEMPALIRAGAERVELLDGHTRLMAAVAGVWVVRAARMNSRILSRSFSPGLRSTPDETSTPGACVIRSAVATLSGSRPPESMKGMLRSRCSSRCQSNDLPSPPGRVASRGARASNSSRSAIVA